MAFDPDEYLAGKQTGFDPDAYIAEKIKPEQAQPETPSALSQVGRQLGLTGRAAIEGLGDIAGIVGGPISAITGGALRRPQEIASDVATRLGLPQPETATERFVQAAGRGVTGAGAGVGLGGILARAPAITGQTGRFLAAQPAAQATAAIGGAGGAQLAREGGAGEIGQAVGGVAGALSPTAIARGAPAVGGTLADIVGGVGTHTGGESLRQATRAGFEGGKRAEAFLGGMRGKTEMTDVLQDVRANLDTMAAERAAQYRSGMADVSKDKTVLDFGGVDKAMKDAYDMATYKGQIKNVDAAKALQKTYDAISDWKRLNPAEYHTPEGMDALKQNIGGILESIPFEQKTARNAVGQIYNSIKSEINKQAPAYSKTMKGYTEASETIQEIEKAFSAGKRASADTQMRKLQSLMRNNANTNYGNRLALAQKMEEQGGKEILPALAGQTLSTITPRGLGGAVMGGSTAGATALTGPLGGALTFAAQSPRLMGEAAYGAGRLASLARPAAPLAFERADTDAYLRSLLAGGMGANQ